MSAKFMYIKLLILVLVFSWGSSAQEQSEGQQLIMATRAARVDAIRNLLALIKGFCIHSETTVRDFLTQNDEINSQFEGYVRGAIEVDRRFFPDGSVEVTMEIDIPGLERIVGQKIIYADSVVRAKGYGAPPGATALRSTRIQEPLEPFIEETGQGVFPDRGDLSDAQRRLMARRAAELDAKRKLAERIYGLRVQSGTTIRDFVAEADYIRSNIEAFLRGAIIVDEKIEGGVYLVTVRVDASTLSDFFN
jgi:hypothetical protein